MRGHLQTRHLLLLLVIRVLPCHCLEGAVAEGTNKAVEDNVNVAAKQATNEGDHASLRRGLNERDLGWFGFGSDNTAEKKKAAGDMIPLIESVPCELDHNKAVSFVGRFGSLNAGNEACATEADPDSCSTGCCRFSTFFFCDVSNAFPDLPCVCNRNTAANHPHRGHDHVEAEAETKTEEKKEEGKEEADSEETKKEDEVTNVVEKEDEMFPTKEQKKEDEMFPTKEGTASTTTTAEARDGEGSTENTGDGAAEAVDSSIFRVEDVTLKDQFNMASGTQEDKDDSSDGKGFVDTVIEFFGGNTDSKEEDNSNTIVDDKEEYSSGTSGTSSRTSAQESTDDFKKEGSGSSNASNSTATGSSLKAEFESKANEQGSISLKESFNRDAESEGSVSLKDSFNREAEDAGIDSTSGGNIKAEFLRASTTESTGITSLKEEFESNLKDHGTRYRNRRTEEESINEAAFLTPPSSSENENENENKSEEADGNRDGETEAGATTDSEPLINEAVFLSSGWAPPDSGDDEPKKRRVLESKKIIRMERHEEMTKEESDEVMFLSPRVQHAH